eukprot:UN32163
MEKWGVFCGWLFLVMTIISTIIYGTEYESAGDINLVEHLIYIFSYTTFLVYYEWTDATPNVFYMFGVTLYTIGYGYYAHLYYETVTEGTDWERSYQSGSL